MYYMFIISTKFLCQNVYAVNKDTALQKRFNRYEVRILKDEYREEFESLCYTERLCIKLQN